MHRTTRTFAAHASRRLCDQHHYQHFDHQCKQLLSISLVIVVLCFCKYSK